MMDHQKKLDFVLKMTKHALEHLQPQHFASGGTALDGPSTVGTANAVGSPGIAGAVGSVLGTNNNFEASGVNLNAGTNTAQLNQAYTGAQNALGQLDQYNTTVQPGVAQGIGTQGALTNQLLRSAGANQGASYQNSLANQLQNASANNQYVGTQGALTNQLLQQTGSNQGSNIQNQLAQQLQNQASGGGPNPAQAALNQNTGENISQAAALAASTRGAGTNAGLIASNAANQGARTQQQAVGQAATLQAQQQLAAQSQLGNLGTSLAGQQLAGQAQLQNLAGTQGQQQLAQQSQLGNIAGTQVQQQLAQQAQLGSIAGNQVGQGLNSVQVANQANQNEQNILQGANTATNNAAVSAQQNINNVNAQVAAGNQNSNQNVIAGIGNFLSSAGKAAAGVPFAEGGQVPAHIKGMADLYHPGYYADGGMAWQNSSPVYSPIVNDQPVQLPQYQPNALSKLGSSDEKEKPKAPPVPGGGAAILGGSGAEAGGAGGLATAAALANGGKVDVGQKLKGGGKVPGKPQVSHNAYSNDTVDAKLSPGEVVIDLNTLKDKGELGKKARFVAANIERRKMGRAL